MLYKKYDKIIVGSGLYGSTMAYLARQQGKRCLVLERRSHIGGNIRDEIIEGINVHQYGAHIFHTDNEGVWEFMNQFADFVPYVHIVMARNGGKMYHLPFNMNTFYDVYGVIRPEEVAMILREENRKEHYHSPKNLEEQAVNLIGRTIYDLLVKGYTEKQWGRKATELSPDLIMRLPIRETFDNRYFNDQYQGIPRDGYTKIIKKMLVGIEVMTNVDFNSNKEYWMLLADEIVYTGMVDELMDFQLGELGYRSIRFETELLEKKNYQGLAVVNETGTGVAYTRTIEHKHFYYDNHSEHTIITKEYPNEWHRGLEPFYVINDNHNSRLYGAYCNLIECIYPKVTLGGRLGDYKYYDMDDVVLSAIQKYH